MFIPNILAQELTKSADKYWNTSLLKIQKLQTKGLSWYSEKRKIEPWQVSITPPPFHCWLLALLIGHDTSPKAKCPCSCTSCIDKGNNLHRKGNLKLKNSLKKAIMSSFQFEETLLMPIWVRLNVKISCSFTHAFFLSIVNMTSWWRKPFFDTACYQPATLITKLESVAGMWAWNS